MFDEAAMLKLAALKKAMNDTFWEELQSWGEDNPEKAASTP